MSAFVTTAESLSTTSEKQRERVRFNVSGRRFETWDVTLKRYPDTLLGSELMERYHNSKTGEYILNRDPLIFKYVLNFYRTGKLHCFWGYCHHEFVEELNFYGIPVELVNSCCEDFLKKDKSSNVVSKCSKEFSSVELIPRTTPREKLWHLFEYPQQTLLGRLILYFVGLFILISVIGTITETIPCKEKHPCGDVYRKGFFMVEAICVGAFTLEFLARLWASPSRKQFMKEILNVIDLVAIIPFYVTLVFLLLENTGADLKFLTALKVLRVIRVFKLARHSAKLRELGMTIKNASSDLAFLSFALFMAILLFASVIYFAESNQEPPTFTSIVDSMWYAGVTIITLGYGDTVPVSVFGKILGSLCCVFGLFVVSLVVPVIQEKEKG